MSGRVDLNADLGEGFGSWTMGADEALLGIVTSASVACGFHAGDPSIMRRTVRLAREHGVAVGAHPGLPDLVGFGRRAMAVSPDDAYALTVYQVGALAAIARAQGVTLQHVKPHGALYTASAAARPLADAIAAATRDAGAGLGLVGQAGSAHEDAARLLGVPFAAEVFADRAYAADGRLVPRGVAGAVIEDPGEAAGRAVTMAGEGRVRAAGGEWVAVRADTICVHGDGPRALDVARAVRSALEAAGIRVAAPGTR